MSRFPCLEEVFGQFWDGIVDQYSDPVAALDGGIGEAKAVGFTSVDCRSEVERLINDAPQGELLDSLEDLGGNRLRNLGVRVGGEQVCHAAARRFSLDTDDRSGAGFREALILPRVSSWADRATAETAVTEVLRAHRSYVEAWAADPLGHPRIWLSVNLGRELGDVELRPEVPDEDGQRTFSGVTQAVVVMGRVPEGVFVQTSYPDLPLDPQWAQRFPDLPHVYGGWFGQGWREEFGNVYWAFELVTKRLNEPARGQVIAQLHELMALPEPDVRAALNALGSYALPEGCGAWVERLHWALSSWPASVPVDEPLHSRDA